MSSAWLISLGGVLTVLCTQGLTMDLSMGPHFSITSASLSAFDTIAIIILVPIYDRLLIPLLRRVNLAPTYLQRIGIGLGVSHRMHV